MKRDEILEFAKKIVVGARAKDYGEASGNHKRIAYLWSAITGRTITEDQVYLMMIAVKISRLCETPNHTDSWIDICGYSALGGEAYNKDDKQ